MKLERNDYMKVAIETDKLTKKFDKFTAVNEIDLNIFEGEIFAILGPNGAGKTTFIKMLSTTLGITSGNATILGYDVKNQSTKVRNLIGLTGQYASIDEDLTAIENMKIYGRLYGLSRKEAAARGEELLKQFSLYDAKDKRVKGFSGGMRRRCDLAVSLIMKPKIVFLDEPTTGLDPRTRGEMWNVIRSLAKEGSTIVLTTQYLEEADQLADRIAIINKGQLVSLGTADELKNELASTQFVIKFIYNSDIEFSSKLIAEVSKVKPVVLPEQNSIAVAISDTKLMMDILFNLEKSNIDIHQFAVRKPSLDEVFLETTKEGEDDE